MTVSETSPPACRLFKVNGEGMKEVVAGALYMKVMLGRSFSVALLKFIKQPDERADVSAKPHSHGEEITLVLEGGARMFTAEGECEVHKGDLIITPPRLAHGGINLFDGGDVCMRLNLVTPPREEYRSEDETPYYPVAGKGEARSAPVRAVGGSAPSQARSQYVTLDRADFHPAGDGSSQLARLLGVDVSVTLIRSLARSGKADGAQAVLHGRDHGEEVVVMLKGGLSFREGGSARTVGEREAVLIPAGVEIADARPLFREGESLRLAIATPPRGDYFAGGSNPAGY